MGPYAIKTDPKAWFAAERTCLHWMSASMLLAVSAATLDGLVKYACIVTAASLALYSFYRYSQRVQAFGNQSVVSNSVFNEILGPLVLSTALSCILLIGFVSQIAHLDDQGT